MKSDISFCLKVCYTEHVISYFNLRLSDESYFQEVLIMAIIDLATENFQAEITKSDKPVLVDFWATWCGPCCAEIPHMEKLAAHYAKNKKIVLLSISLDKNKAKWEKKLAEDKPQWRQFICLDAFDSEVCKNYGINAIPRFLFFDKDGKVISLDAPRPSSAKITEYIDRHIR